MGITAERSGGSLLPGPRPAGISCQARTQGLTVGSQSATNRPVVLHEGRVFLSFSETGKIACFDDEVTRPLIL